MLCFVVLNCWSVIYLLQLLSSWGDPYYIGLNGIELFAADGQPIQLTANSMTVLLLLLLIPLLLLQCYYNNYYYYCFCC